MATKTFEELKQLAIQIRDEKTNKANTATRIGTQMIEHLNKLEQEYYNKDGVAEQLKTRDDELARLDKMTTEYNVSVLHPTSGSGGSNKYTLETAIAQVPSKYRSIGIKCAFINEAGKPESWKYQGGSWGAASFTKEADGGNKILEWKTDAATTRKQVALSERKLLLQISYRNSDGDIVNEQYIGTSLADTEWVKDINWEKIAGQTQLNIINEQTIQNKNNIDSLIGGEKNISSSYDMRYTNTADSLTKEDGYSYSEYTGVLANKVFNIPINVQTSFPKSGTYHVFAKIRLVTSAEDVKGVMTNSIQCNNATVTTNNTDVEINEIQTLYLGKVKFSARPGYFYLSVLQLKTLTGGNPMGSNTVKYEYYGGYLVPDDIVGAYNTSEIANKLDYSSQSSVMELNGWKSEVDNNLESISKDSEEIKQNIQVLNKPFSIVKSAYDVRKDVFSVGNGFTDEGDFIRVVIPQPTYSKSFQTKNYFKADAGKYSVYAKLKISTDDSYDTKDLYANVYLRRQGKGSSNSGLYNIPLNEIVSAYLGDFDDDGTNSYFYISLEYIRKDGPAGVNQTALGNVTFDFYGAYYVKESDISGIKGLISENIDFKELESSVVLNSISSENSKSAETAKKSEIAEVSNLTNNINNTFRNASIKIYGDSLVVYIGWKNLMKLFNTESVMQGIGGVKVCNNSKDVNYGLCTLERIAAFPRNMKLLVIYGGANDNAETTEIPYSLDEKLLGSISDEPLKIADMLNYRVTSDNISNTNTLGRAQTFYQGYKTMLRNIMALYPNCQIICVTQHRYYYYLKPEGGFSETPILRRDAYAKVKAMREIAEEYSVPVCDLWATSGVNDRNRRYTLIDMAGVLVHQTEATAAREESLIINKILEIAPKFEIPNYTTTNGEDIIEMKKWVIDVRDEVECNVMTLEEAITAFVQKTSSEAIELKNNMLLPFYYADKYLSKVYVLKDYTQPSLTASWEEWVGGKIDDPNEG